MEDLTRKHVEKQKENIPALPLNVQEIFKSMP